MAKVRSKGVATYAGVSIATVSHVVNNTCFVNAETRQKALDAIEALNYRPNAVARGLATNVTRKIGLVISEISNPFFTVAARGVEDEEGQVTAIENMVNTGAKGILVTPSGAKAIVPSVQMVEHTNALLNKFQILVQVFRHARASHTQITRVVAGPVNRRIQITSLKTYAGKRTVAGIQSRTGPIS